MKNNVLWTGVHILMPHGRRIAKELLHRIDVAERS